MNLTRALEVALPDIPARKLAESYPRLDPGTSSREHIEDGAPIVRVYIPSSKGMYTLTPDQWALAQLFDGQRSYEEISELYSQDHGNLYDEEGVREFAEELEANEFWYKTSQEKNMQLLQMSREERKKKQQQVKSIWADLSDVNFPAFNPDRFVTWAHERTKFFYTTWFTVVTLIGFAISGVVTITHWNQIWSDTLDFYNFSNKTWGDVFALYTLGMVVVAVHEFAHAHACKHFGGRVPAMGFALVYLTPAFYTDTTEGFVKGSRWERFVIVMAGIWSELILCAIATPIWLDTPPQTLIHDGAHFIMMMTGMMSLVLNWNPLMKLDGYYMLGELVGILDIKESSTAYVSAWVKRNIWRLPVEVPYVPKRRRFGFAVYALLSGAYSYMVLYILARFAGNFVRNFSPEWGFIPEIGVALIIFRSRIRLLVNFMKFLYLDKKDRIVAWFTLRHAVAAGATAILLLAIPIRRESITGKFLLESERTATVRARVTGTIREVNVREAQSVAAGERLARLENLPLESDYEGTRSLLVVASDRAAAASRHYVEYGTALKERQHLDSELQQITEKRAALDIVSPISGIVMSPRVQEKLGSTMIPGQEILQVADIGLMRARIYVSEWDMNKIRTEADAMIRVDGILRGWDAQVSRIGSEPTEISQGLNGESNLNGVTPLHYYVVDLSVANVDGKLRPGMTGLARIYGNRRTMAGMVWEGIRNFLGRKFW
jgi:putative peptide zinc metalloprotease protein